jgi:hypothetical protein
LACKRAEAGAGVLVVGRRQMRGEGRRAVRRPARAAVDGSRDEPDEQSQEQHDKFRQKLLRFEKYRKNLSTKI